MFREVMEETGLTPLSYRFCGIVTFLSDMGTEKEAWEYMCLYHIEEFKGEIKECDEGVLEWVDKEKILDLDLWEGDRLFLRYMQERRSFFSLKLVYEEGNLVQAVVDGKDLEFFDILDENGNYRNTYSILKDISEIYSEIQKQDKAMGTNRAQALIEELAGKNRSNILSSLLTNGSLLEQVKETSEHSDNSALEENQKYLESTEAKIAQLQTQLQELATVTINSDMFKGVIDTATAFLNIVTQILDKLPLLSTAIGGFAGFKLSQAGLGKQLNINHKASFNSKFYRS